MSTVIEVPLSAADKLEIHLRDASPRTFRFLDAQALLRAEAPSVKIVQFGEIPTDIYATLSYVWDDLVAEGDVSKDQVIFVDGLEEKDRISVRMLQSVCKAAQKLDCNYLWMDKLGIRQDEPDGETYDKNWQMDYMYSLYNQCKACLIAPGGMLRFPAINEYTRWMERAWTLQEGIAPKLSFVLLNWTFGEAVLQYTWPARIEEVEKGAVAMMNLKDVLQCSMKGGPGNLILENTVSSKAPTECSIQVLRKTDQSQFAVKGLFGAIEEQSGDAKQGAIWRCLIMRSARYKEDMIYASMGVLGVSITKERGIKQGYTDEQVTKVLITCVEKLIEKGSRALWFGLAPSLGPAIGYSGLPALPLSSNIRSGFQVVKIRDRYEVKPSIDEKALDDWWWLKGSPKVLDVGAYTGDLTIEATARPIKFMAQSNYSGEDGMQRSTPNQLINVSIRPYWQFEMEQEPEVPAPTVQIDQKDGTQEEEKKPETEPQTNEKKTENAPSLPGSKAEQPKKEEGEANAYAIYVGQKEFYIDGGLPTMVDPNSSLIMLVKRLDSYRWTNMGYAWGDSNISQTWKSQTFIIGG